MKNREILEKVKRIVNEGTIEYSYHSIFDKAIPLLVDRNDIKKVINTGKLHKIETAEEVKVTIVGKCVDRRTRLAVVGKLTEQEIFKVITVYKT